jgi:hypothetical protein
MYCGELSMRGAFLKTQAREGLVDRCTDSVSLADIEAGGEAMGKWGTLSQLSLVRSLACEDVRKKGASNVED